MSFHNNYNTGNNGYHSNIYSSQTGQSRYRPTTAGAIGENGLSMQSVRDMAGVGVDDSWQSENNFFSSKQSGVVKFDKKNKNFYFKVFGGALFFMLVLFFVLRKPSEVTTNKYSTIPKHDMDTQHKQVIEELPVQDIGHEEEHQHWTDFGLDEDEEDWIDEYDFDEEEIVDFDDPEDHTKYADIKNVDTPQKIKSTAEDFQEKDQTSNDEKEGDNVEVISFPKSLHIYGRSGEYHLVNGHYQVVMHPHHNESPWIHGGRLIWKKVTAHNKDVMYLYFDVKYHNWILSSSLNLSNPNPVAFFPDHSVVPVKGIGSHGAKHNHYWYFRSKDEGGKYRINIDHALTITDSGSIVDSLIDPSNTSKSEKIISLKLFKRHITIDKTHTEHIQAAHKAGYDPYV